MNFRIYEVYSDVEAHKKNLELAIASQKVAIEDMKLVDKRWKASQLPFVALIDAQNNLNTTRASVINNQFDLKEDLINLSYESGIIYQELELK